MQAGPILRKKKKKKKTKKTIESKNKTKRMLSEDNDVPCHNRAPNKKKERINKAKASAKFKSIHLQMGREWPFTRVMVGMINHTITIHQEFQTKAKVNT